MRVRVNGLVCDLDDTPSLDKKKKHSIEVVVDRFKIKAGIEQRLAESLETCLEQSDGLVLVQSMEDEKAEPFVVFFTLCLPLLRLQSVRTRT